MAAVTICSDFGAQKDKSLSVSIISPSICHEVMGLDAMILVLGLIFFKQVSKKYKLIVPHPHQDLIHWTWVKP